MSQSNLIIVGSSHKTAPLKLLESLSLSPEGIRRLLPQIKKLASLEEAVLLSTCNRTEILGIAQNPDFSTTETEK